MHRYMLQGGKLLLPPLTRKEETIDNFELTTVLRVLNRIAHALECIERNQQAVILGAESEYMPLNQLATYEAMRAENLRQVAQEEANVEMPPTAEDFYRQEGTYHMTEEERRAHYQAIMEEANLEESTATT